MALNILFVGGTGQISLPCVELAVKAGHKVSVFNRGQRDATLPAGVASIVGDMKDAASYTRLGDTRWDVVAQFMVFTPEQMQLDIATFSGKIGQYVFISSASVYQKPPGGYVITEQTPAVNPYWGYSQAKIACENALKASKDLAWTIVRPSHTVRSGMPSLLNDGDNIVHRMMLGKALVVAGDGNAPWTLTRSEDFAVPFVKLLGNKAALGEVFHITGDYAFTWDEIYKAIGKGFGIEPRLVHVPTDTLVAYNPDWAGPLLGDKSWTALFDNSKVKRVAGDFTTERNLDVVLAQSISHARARLAGKPPQPAELDPLFDRIVAEQSALGRG